MAEMSVAISFLSFSNGSSGGAGAVRAGEAEDGTSALMERTLASCDGPDVELEGAVAGDECSRFGAHLDGVVLSTVTVALKRGFAQLPAANRAFFFACASLCARSFSIDITLSRPPMERLLASESTTGVLGRLNLRCRDDE